MGFLYILLAVIVLVIITFLTGVRIVPQGMKYVVQRLGKYRATLDPGLHFIIPFIDTVAYKVTTKDITLDTPTQEVITKDNAVIQTNAIAYINIVEPNKAVYGVDNFKYAIQNLIQTTLRSIIGEMDLDEALSSREIIKTKLIDSISDDITDWGIIIKTVEIQDINPSPDMQKAMEDQAAAERRRRAMVTEAEGEKKSVILAAEGNLEASRKDAEAKIILANASAEAIQRVAKVIDSELPVMYLLGERYIESVKDVSRSENAKTVIYPADLQNTIKGLLK